MMPVELAGPPPLAPSGHWLIPIRSEPLASCTRSKPLPLGASSANAIRFPPGPSVRARAFNQPQMVNVYLGSQSVASFAVDSVNPVLRRIPLRADQLGSVDMAELRIGVDRAFTPASMPGGGKDTRELGIRIYRLFVDPS